MLSHGPIGNMAQEICQELAPTAIGHYNFPFVKPMDQDALQDICLNYDTIITLEDGSIMGGFGSAILEGVNALQMRTPVKSFGVPDVFLEHGTQEELYALAQMDKKTVIKYIRDLYANERFN